MSPWRPNRKVTKVLIIILLVIIAFGVAPEIMGAITGIGCVLALIGGLLFAVFVALVLTGVIV